MNDQLVQFSDALAGRVKSTKPIVVPGPSHDDAAPCRRNALRRPAGVLGVPDLMQSVPLGHARSAVEVAGVLVPHESRIGLPALAAPGAAPPTESLPRPRPLAERPQRQPARAALPENHVVSWLVVELWASS